MEQSRPGRKSQIGRMDVPRARGGLLSGIGTDVKIVIVYSLVVLALFLVPLDAVAVIRQWLGIGVLSFIPGYLVIAWIDPLNEQGNPTVKAALSVAISLLTTFVIGLVLSLALAGVTLDGVLFCVTLLTLIGALPVNEKRRSQSARAAPSRGIAAWFRANVGYAFGERGRGRTITLALCLALLALVAAITLTAVAPVGGDKYTELSLLNANGEAGNYPDQFYLGEDRPIQVIVANHESRQANYNLSVQLDNNGRVTQIYSETFTLGHNQTTVKTVALKPDQQGLNMKMNFILYLDGNTTAPYRQTTLRVSVI